jgi:predicted GIY-YIG superfamily endonuclease
MISRISKTGPAVGAYLYILLCADNSYYIGITRGSLEKRVAEHQTGVFTGYTVSRRPVQLVFYQEFQRITDAIAAERQLKGWRREKKAALIRGEFNLLRMLASRAAGAALRPSRRTPVECSSG